MERRSWIGCADFSIKPDIDLLRNPTRKLIDDFVNDLALAADKRRMVLMLDTFDQMTALDDWARDVTERLHPNTLFIIAGRALPNWDARGQVGWRPKSKNSNRWPKTL